MSTPVRPGSVVLGVDGSAASDAAVEWAVDYATARHALLCILHGAGDLGDDLIPFKEDAREMLSKASRKVTDHALEIVTRRAPDLEVEIQEPFEDARRALLDVADASMLVLGTRGRGTLTSLLLGSVSQAVVSHSPCPVTVVRPAEGRGAAAPVVVGVDLDGTADSALDVGFEIASMGRRPLEAIHAWAAHDTFIDSLSYELRLEIMDEHERGFAEAMSGYAEKYPDVPVTTRMADDAAPGALVRASESAAHLVVGGRPARRLPRYFGSVGRAAVEHAHCPVTVVRHASLSVEGSAS